MSMPPASTAIVPVGERALMRRGVDAARQAGDDDEARGRRAASAMSRAKRRPLAEALRAPTTATARRVSRSRVAAHAEQRRRILDRGERRRIIAARPRRRAARRPRRRRQARARPRPWRRSSSGRCRPPRRAISGSASSAAAAEPKRVKQLIERDRPDILAADEAQPVEPFGGVEGARCGHRRIIGAVGRRQLAIAALPCRAMRVSRHG